MRSRLALPALLALASAAPASAAPEPARIATLAPEGSLWMKQMRRGAAAIEKATDGRVVVRYYAGGVQGDEKDVVRKMSIGHLDGAALTAVGLGMIYPGVRVLQLPGLWDSLEELDHVRDKMWPYFRKRFREKGFELLSLGDVGWIYLMSTRPIRSLEDFQKAKVWVWDGDPMSSKLFQVLGLRGVPLGAPQVLPALSTGKVEAVFNSPYGAIALQWHTKLRYMSSLPVTYGIGGMVMVKDVWERASSRDRKIQRHIGERMSRATVERVRRDNRRALQTIRRYGVQVLETPAEMERELVGQAKKLWKSWVGEIYSQEELDLVLRYRDEFRAKNPGHRGETGAIEP